MIIIWCAAQRCIHIKLPMRLSSSGSFLYVSFYATSSYHSFCSLNIYMKLKSLYPRMGNLSNKNKADSCAACVINFSGNGYSICMNRNKNPYKFDYFVFLFFTIAVAGWVWEVILYFFTEHAFINRGIYRGPYLPIYGAGGLLLCVLFKSLRKKPLRVFGLSAVLCSFLEYLSSYFLELKWGVRWWDYTGHFLNINGRICLLGVVAFGIGGTALVCLFLPFYEKMYWKISPKWRICLCVVLLLLFVMDAAYCAMHPNTGYGISSRSTSRP